MLQAGDLTKHNPAKEGFGTSAPPYTNMGRFSLIGSLLLLFVASSRSRDTTGETTQTGEPLIVSSIASPSVNQPKVAKMDLITDPTITTIRVGKATSSMSNDDASTGGTTEHSEVQNVSLTTHPTTGLRDPYTNVTTVRFPSIRVRGNVDGSESPEVHHNATNLPNANNGTDGGDVDGHGTTSEPNREGTTTTSITKRPGQETTKGPDRKSNRKADIIKILIGVTIAILIFILLLMVFMILRKKKRSGSFRTNSKKMARQDVWAGQVPELADGKPTQEVVGNGRAGNGPEAANEEEMVTFVSGEKKMDSMVEMKELESGEKPEANGGKKLSTVEEKTPLLEEASEASPKPNDTEAFFPAPPVEQ